MTERRDLRKGSIFIKPYFSYNGSPISVASREMDVIPLARHSFTSISNTLEAIPFLLYSGRVYIFIIYLIAAWVMPCGHDLKKAHAACTDDSILIVYQICSMCIIAKCLFVICIRRPPYFTHIRIGRQPIRSPQHFYSCFCKHINIRWFCFFVSQFHILYFTSALRSACLAFSSSFLATNR